MAVRPSFDALIERLFRNLTGVGIPKAERPEALTFEVVLTPGEAVRGVEVPIAVPRIEPCRECGGAGRMWLFACAACVGQRIVITEHIVPISIPPPIHPESVIEMSQGELGIQNLYLRLYIRIQP
jgi:DnaJ-class molecular chaperone